MWQRYEASLDRQERADLMTQAQQMALEEYLFVPIYINSFTMGIGPRVGGTPQDYLQIPMSVLPDPSEDLRLKATQ